MTVGSMESAEQSLVCARCAEDQHRVTTHRDGGSNIADGDVCAGCQMPLCDRHDDSYFDNNPHWGQCTSRSERGLARQADAPL